MEMRYRQDTTLLRKDLRIAAVEGRASRWQSIASLSLLALVLLGAIAAIVVYYSRRKREHEYRRQVATVTGLRMEIVRNRVSPHFVFNALNVIMPSLKQHTELEESFGLLIQMLRNNLIASEQIATPLSDEIKLVKNYLQLVTVNNRRNIAFDWQIADDVPTDALIPSMSIQIPVENAVKYAFTEQDDACITISVNRQDDAISVAITDNGVGYDPAGADAFSERGTGSGLKMLRRTVELLNMRNRRPMSFAIENRNKNGDGAHGTRATMLVPLDYQFEL
jgi:LytS/YehU family sensor histidine kinase